jgi:restriction system protein
MARRKSGGADAIMDLVARLPWWAGVGAAALSYLVFHYLAGQKVVPIANTAGVAPMVIKTMWASLSSILQYIIPLLCLVGAAVSAVRQRERNALLNKAATGHTASIVDGMSWQQFETLVGEALRQQGYRVVETGGDGADGGVDLIVTKGNEKFLVQCKQWRALKVGVAVVRELYGMMAAKGAAGGFVVTSGSFTADASDFAKGRNVTLVDGPALAKWIQAARAPKAAPAPNAPKATAVAPSCPVCGKLMVERIAGRGANAGNAFWGCSDFPRCKGTQPLG